MSENRKINARQLHRELENTGIKIGGCSSSGEVWAEDGVTEIQDRPDVKAVIKAHKFVDPEIHEQKLRELRDKSEESAKQIPNWAKWSEQEAIDYIEENVENIKDAKKILKAMARMILALRDKNFPNIMMEE
jgi:5,10-methenyltetrahydromethanopterin hydrogenase